MKSRRCNQERQRGAVLILFALALVVLFGFLGLVMDLGATYDLKTELQNAADSAVLAGAKDLNGTATGINNAVAKAKALAASNQYSYSSTPLVLQDADIGFSTGPDAATWLSVADARAAPAGLLFIKVTTRDVSHTNWFMQVNGGLSETTVSASAVAGRFSLGIAPIGVCALSTTKYGQLPHPAFPGPPAIPASIELTEYGFRRGIAYDVITINPLGAAANKFLLNPLDVPSGPYDNSCNPSNNNNPVMRPFLCSGSASIISTLPGYVYANTGMQATLNAELNSRFVTGGSCTVPPDANIKEYTAGAATPGWMSPAPGTGNQGVKLVTAGGATVPFTPPTVTQSDWGVLWSYAKAAQYGSGSPPFATYGTADWPSLYPSSPAAVSYPTAPAGADTPYYQSSGSYFQAGSGARERRVLNFALVDCTTLQNNGKCSTLKVLGVGRFFMPVQADLPKSLYGEFAGLIPDAELTADIKLYH